jgi:hypothetical protein
MTFYTNIDSHGILEISTLTTLLHLQIEGCDLLENGVAALNEVLSANGSLRTMCVPFCRLANNDRGRHVDAEAAGRFAITLACHSSLHTLDLSNNGLSADEAGYIGEHSRSPLRCRQAQCYAIWTLAKLNGPIAISGKITLRVTQIRTTTSCRPDCSRCALCSC